MLEKRPWQRAEPGGYLLHGVGERGVSGKRLQGDRREARQSRSSMNPGAGESKHFRLNNGIIYSVGNSIRPRNVPELKVRTSVLTLEDSFNTGVEEVSV